MPMSSQNLTINKQMYDPEHPWPMLVVPVKLLTAFYFILKSISVWILNYTVILIVNRHERQYQMNKDRED